MPKPRILMVATGGTIASAETEVGLAPQLTGEQLAAYVPQAAELADIDISQPMNIDSTNMCPADWLRIAGAIVERYDDYDGFVVLHGTDTMAYTAAALSYLVQQSPKPIVLTGSQQPMASPFTDARINLYQSVLYAADPASRDVSVVFGGKVVAGTRARKQRTMSFNAFTSVNYPELALIRNGRIIRTALAPSRVAADHPAGAALPDGPRVYDSLSTHVIVLKLTPGLLPATFDLLRDDYEAIILETFGIGGVPDTLRDAIFGWVDSGHTLVITTQVPEEGLDLGVYEVGRAFAEHPGILRGADMTTEALVAKTMWALAQARGASHLRGLFYRPVNCDHLPEEKPARRHAGAAQRHRHHVPPQPCATTPPRPRAAAAAPRRGPRACKVTSLWRTAPTCALATSAELGSV